MRGCKLADGLYRRMLPQFTISSDSVMKYNHERQNKICAFFPNFVSYTERYRNKPKSYLQILFETGEAIQAGC